MTMKVNNLKHLSTGESTNWPTDRQKVPDLIDFCVAKSIPSPYCLNVKSCLDLLSDHSPILISLSTLTFENIKPLTLTSKNTNWNVFRDLLNNTLNLDVLIKQPPK